LDTTTFEFAGRVTSPPVGTWPPQVVGLCQSSKLEARWGQSVRGAPRVGVGGFGIVTVLDDVAGVMKGPWKLCGGGVGGGGVGGGGVGGGGVGEGGVGVEPCPPLDDQIRSLSWPHPAFQAQLLFNSGLVQSLPPPFLQMLFA